MAQVSKSDTLVFESLLAKSLEKLRTSQTGNNLGHTWCTPIPCTFH